VYFVTICTHQRRHLFGEIRKGLMALSPLGCIVADEWRRSQEIRDEIWLDTFVVMPDHMHGIVWMEPDDHDEDEAPRLDGRPLPHAMPDAAHRIVDGRGSCGGDEPGVLHRPPRSLGSFVAGFKSAATLRINRSRGTPGAPVWQRNYHDRIIRSMRHLRAARRYIHDNPARWHEKAESEG
jgi:REP element-mobilizing transposase RayT